MVASITFTRCLCYKPEPFRLNKTLLNSCERLLLGTLISDIELELSTLDRNTQIWPYATLKGNQLRHASGPVRSNLPPVTYIHSFSDHLWNTKNIYFLALSLVSKLYLKVFYDKYIFGIVEYWHLEWFLFSILYSAKISVSMIYSSTHLHNKAIFLFHLSLID